MARPTKLTPAVQKHVCEALELGVTYLMVAKAVGVAYETFNEWRKTNPQFSEAVEKAEAAGVAARLARINAAGMAGNWQADAWWLERVHPRDYGRTIQEHAGETKLRIEYSNDWRNAATHGGDDDGDE